MVNLKSLIVLKIGFSRQPADGVDLVCGVKHPDEFVVFPQAADFHVNPMLAFPRAQHEPVRFEFEKDQVFLEWPDPFPGFLLGAQPCRPTSRGYLEISSADPFSAPRIIPNSLSTDHDIGEMLEATRLLRRLAAAPSLAEAVAEEIAPGKGVEAEADLLADIRKRASSVFHPVSTCRMGQDDRTNVVDSELKVHGIKGLRVIDASIFPSVTSGNTNAPTVMVAEKGADLVLRDAERPITES